MAVLSYYASAHPTPFLRRSGLPHFFASIGVFLLPKHVKEGEHRILREVFLPQSGGQESHLAKGKRLNPLQYIHQIGIGVHLVKLTGHKQALYPPNTASPYCFNGSTAFTNELYDRYPSRF